MGSADRRFRTGPQEALADIAAGFLGARETGNNGMGRDPRMREIFEADNTWIAGPDGAMRTDGYAWCSAFVSLCVQNLVSRSTAYWGVQPPREASVYFFRVRWATSQGCLVLLPGDRTYQPHRGDIVVFRPNRHIGIVDRVQAGVTLSRRLRGASSSA